MSWLNPAGPTGRFLAFYFVLAIPLLRLLLRAQYELWRLEVLALLALFAMPCLILARLPGGLPVFFGLLVPWTAFFAASGVQADLAPTISWWWVFGALTLLTGAGAALFRERFPLLISILLAGMLLAEGGLVVNASGILSGPPPGLPLSSGLHHAIYLVLDEQTGIAGFRQEIPECANAARIWQETLSRHGFTIYPNAYSNYNMTEQSLSSVLNDRLLTHGAQFLRRHSVIGRNVLFNKAAALGMDLAVYQSDYVRFNTPPHKYRLVREYDPNDVSAMLTAPANWIDKAWRIAVWYSLLHRPLAVLLSRYPGVTEAVRAGPLAVRRIWPQTILRDILEADRPTLFFAHLLAPHYPYVLDARGSTRPLDQWTRPLTFSPAAYDQRCRGYCEQSAYLARQVDEFVTELQRVGLLPNVQIFLHGDHGGRLRVGPNMLEAKDPVKAFAASPTRRDLLDSFSTMLAVRLPGQTRPSVDPAKASLLFLLRKIGGRADAESGPDTNMVYLIGPGGAILQSIPILDYWKE